MAGPRSGARGKERHKAEERRPSASQLEAELAPIPQADTSPAQLLTGNSDEQIDLLSQREIPRVQRQRLATQIGRRQGNRHLQRVIDAVASRLAQQEAVSVAPVARDPWDDPFAQPMSVPGSIPTDLMQSIDLDTLSDDELRDRLERLQEALATLAHDAPEAEPLEQQAIQIRQLLSEREVENRVREELESFLEGFQNITVTVRWGEDTGTQSVMRSEEVTVHPPYFMNVINRRRAHRRTLQRYDAAQRNRRAADRATRQLLSEISRREGRRGSMGAARAKVGKSTPEEIQRILQRALDRDLIQPGGGRNRPNSEDLRNWLIRYGIGVDCSAFVSQALNQVTAALGGQSEGLRRGSGGLQGGARGFTRITNPADLRPGDTMYKRGHIRIITSVRREAGGDVYFTTAESRAGGSYDPGGDRADVGPSRAEWRYHNGQLQRRNTASDLWANSTEQPVFGRYRRLAQAMQGATGGAGP
jgi:hypothetical protein